MPSPTPKPLTKPSKDRNPSSRRAATSNPSTEPVDPVWLIKAFGISVVAALVCGYLSLCLLLYQGQWQLVLHPSRTTPAPTNIAGTPIQTIHFGVDESATPQLAGWWIPAEPAAPHAASTVLYLPSGDGSLADAQSDLAAIHSLGLNLFAFDYRGYGQSAASHPSQQRMTQDAASAWQYLTVSRALPPGRIILFGNGVGSFFAAQLAAQYPEVPAVVLDSPRPDLLDVVLSDPRVKFLPVRALFHERFNVTQYVASLKTPKLLLINDIAGPSGEGQSGQRTPQQLRALIDIAATPKVIVHLAASDRAGSAYRSELSRFLDEYLH